MTHTTCYWPSALVPVGKKATQPTTVDAKGVLNACSFKSGKDSIIFVDEQNVLVSSVASSGLLKIAKASAAHTCQSKRGPYMRQSFNVPAMVIKITIINYNN